MTVAPTVQTLVMTWWRRWRHSDDAEADFGVLVEEASGGSSYAYESLVRHLIMTGMDLSRSGEGEVAWLRGQDATTWRRIEATARDSSSYADVYPREAELRETLGADCSTLLAVMASFHRSGYVREVAVDILTARDDALADKALALRTTDWVDVIHQKSQNAVLRRIERRHALSIVPLLVASLGQERSKGLLDEYLSRLDSGTLGDLARFASRATRRLLVNRVDLTDEELVQRAIEDDDPLVRSHAAGRLLARRPDAAGELLLRSSGVVRALAVAKAPAAMVLEREEALLLERRAAVRRAAQRRLSHLGRNVVERYRALAAVGTPASTAIVGLGETGSQKDEPRILQLLQHEDEAVRRAALSAARWIVSEPALVEIASAALHDDSELVVRAAARLLRRRVSRIPKKVIADAVASSSRATQLAGLRLARRSDGWSRLEADLTLAADADDTIARQGREDLISWVTRVAPTLYTKPPADQLDAIRRLLDCASLDETLDRAIRFHSGMDQ